MSKPKPPNRICSGERVRRRPFVCKVAVLSYVEKAKDAEDAYAQTCRKINIVGCIKPLYRKRLAIAV